jgi:hypothetical protein
MELRSADLIRRNFSLKTIADELLRICPLTYEIEGNENHAGWIELLHLAEDSRLLPFRETILSFVTDKLRTSIPLQSFLSTTSKEISTDSYFIASAAAIDFKKSHPVGAFLLAYLSMIGWIYKLGITQIYASDEGLPNPGWGVIPFACACTLACKAVDGYWIAKKIVVEARNVFSMTKIKTLSISGINKAIYKYKTLDDEITVALDNYFNNFSWEIRKACRTEKNDWRPEIGAILWTIGQVPESALFRKRNGSSYLPSYLFFNKLVRRSLAVIPGDPLTQYIWLELKDSLPVNLRDYRALFAVINARYHHPRLESGFPVSIAKAYATAIIELFRGDITNRTLQIFYDNFNPFSQKGDMVDAASDFRIAALGIELSKVECDTARRLTSWFAEHHDEMISISMRFACSMVEDSVLYPEWPNINNFANTFLHELIESKLYAVNDTFNPEMLMECVTAVEQLRAAALSYWLMVTPPFPRSDTPAAMEELLVEDSNIRKLLRSAYFLARWDSFPEHYRLFSISVRGGSNPIQAAQDQLRVKTDSDTGRNRYQAARKNLTDLIKKMEKVDADYADKRGNLIPSAKKIFEYLNSHQSID